MNIFVFIWALFVCVHVFVFCRYCYNNIIIQQPSNAIVFQLDWYVRVVVVENRVFVGSYDFRLILCWAVVGYVSIKSYNGCAKIILLWTKSKKKKYKIGSYKDPHYLVVDTKRYGILSFVYHTYALSMWHFWIEKWEREREWVKKNGVLRISKQVFTIWLWISGYKKVELKKRNKSNNNKLRAYKQQ